MIEDSVKERLAASKREEAKRTILREAITRFNNELMDDPERMMLLDRIKRLRRELKLV